MRKTVLPLITAAVSLLICFTVFGNSSTATGAPQLPVFDYLDPQPLVFIISRPEEVQSISANGSELLPHQYSYDTSSGTVTLYKSYLYTLPPGDFTLTAGTEAHAFSVTGGGSNLSALFDSGGTGWTEYLYNGFPDTYLVLGSLSDFPIGDNSWSIATQSNSYHAKIVMPPYLDKSIVLALTLNPKTLYDVNVRINSGSGDKQYIFNAYAGKGASSTIHEIDGAIAYGNSVGFSETSFTATGDKIYFNLAYFVNKVDAQIAIDLTPVTYNAEYNAGDTKIIQNIPHGMTAQCPDINGLSTEWFTDEFLSEPFDFETGITSDIVLYAATPVNGYLPGASANVSGGEFTLKLDNSGNAEYFQYWILANADNTGSFAKDGDNQRWFYLSNYTEKSNFSFNLLDSYCVQGYYNILVRAKNGADIAWEQLYRFNKQDTGAAVISSVQIDGSTVNINGANILQENSVIKLYSFNAQTHQLYIDKEEVYQTDGDTFDLGSLLQNHTLSGNTQLTIVAENTHSSDSIAFFAYFEQRLDSSAAVIVSDFWAEENASGSTVFYAGLSYISGADIDSNILNEIIPRFTVNGIPHTHYEILPQQDTAVLTLKYQVAPTGTGVMFAKICLYSGPEVIDYYQFYYHGNTAPATLSISANSGSLALSQDFYITAHGTVNQSEDVLYAFYREDAANYTLIRSYNKNPDLTFRPAVPGNYKIAVRIMGAGSASYEMQAEKTFTVTDDYPDYGQENLSLMLTDGRGNDVSKTAETGKAYILKADYAQGDGLLYKYLVHTSFTQTIYLSSYSVSGELVFFFHKPGTYTFTVRIVDWQRYGFADISKKISITVT